MYYSQKNKKFKDPRYFLFEEEEKQLGATPDTTKAKPATPTTSISGNVAEQPQGAKEVQIGIAGAFIEPGAADVIEQPYLSGSNMAAEPGAAGVIARARGPIGKNWTYSLTAYGGKDQGGLKDPKPDPDKIVPEQPGAFCDCTGYVSWAAGFWQKRAPFANGMTSNLGTPASNPMPGDIAYRGAPPGGKHGHVGIVTAVNPEGATTEDINNGKADVDIVHCSSRKPAGGAVVEDKNAIKNGWAGRGEGRAKVMFYRPTSLLNSPNASKCPSCPKKGEDKAKAVAGQETEQGATPASAQTRTRPAGEEKKWWQFWKESIEDSSENLLIEETDEMRHNTWDKMMYHLLSEQAEKRRIAEKAFAGKKELDNDEDGVPKWADKNDKDPKAGSKGSKSKGKKGKGKVPPQLKMHIQKKKKSKLDEEIERLEKILFEELTDVPLEEYGEDRNPDMAEEDFEDFEGDEDYEGDDEYDDDDSCPYCGSEEGYDTYSGECEECGYEAHKSTPEEDIDDPEPGEGWGTEEDDEDIDDSEPEEEYLSEAQVKKKQPRLGKVTRNPSGSKKKFHVYVKCGGRVKKISFGDPGLSIKRDSAARRKNFRARHKCDKPAGKDRCTARYWSCYQWRAGKKVEGEE